MAHWEQREFVAGVKQKFPQMFNNKRVLEVGSLDINGSIRDQFENCFYIGIDLDYGPGVDLVVAGQEACFTDNFFDTVISCECFEHNPFWQQTFNNMIRMCSGLVLFTCATEGRHEHGTARTTTGESPFNAEWNYYRNLVEKDFAWVDFSIFDKYEFSTNNNTYDLYFWGIKHV